MILLFGAGGQLGRELSAAVAGAGVSFIGVTREDVDIADAKALEVAIARACPSMLINAAAYTDVDRAEREPDTAWLVNSTGPERLAAAAARHDLPLVHISTDYVFDGRKEGAYAEDDPTAPLSVYGCSKVAGEDAVRRLAPRHLILRTAWLYSAHGKNFLRTILRLAGERDELRVVADQIGSPTSANDLAEAITAILPALLSANAPYGTYHLAGDGETSRHGFAQHIVDEQAPSTNRRPAVIQIASADYPVLARRPTNSVLDSSLFARTFGIRLPHWRQSVSRTLSEVLSVEVRG